MTQKHELQLFSEKKVRTVWDDQTEQWYFSVVDVVEVLTDSKNPTDYLKKIRKRDPELNSFLGTNCPQIAMKTQSDFTVITPSDEVDDSHKKILHKIKILVT